MRTYAVVRYDGSDTNPQLTDYPLEQARNYAKISSEAWTDAVYAVIDEQAKAPIEVYCHGKLLSHGMVRSLVFGLARDLAK